MNNKAIRIRSIFVSLLLCFFLVSLSYAVDLTLRDLFNKIQSNQSKIKDMYAETTTTITSSISMPGAESKGPQKMVQKGKMWMKGKDKSKIEMLSPMKQITITNGDQMAIINPVTGQKMVQDLSKIRGQGIKGSRDQGAMDLEKALEYFDLKVRKLDALKPGNLSAEGGSASGGETYVIEGVPKEANKFLGKMEFYVDSDRWLPVKIMMYDPKGKIVSQSAIEYGEFSGAWTPIKNISDVNSPMGKMNLEMKYENIKINQGVSDSKFKI